VEKAVAKAEAKKPAKKAEPKNTTKKNKVLGNVTLHADPPKQGQESKGDEKSGYLY
jgi:hypothetical protein